MNKHTIENIIIFTVIYINNWNKNDGKTYDTYISEKSKRYLGIDITKIDNIDIRDFSLKIRENESELHVASIDNILNNLENKIDLSEINNSTNIDTNYPIIMGLDMSNSMHVFNIIDSYDNEYYTNIIRKYNLDYILKIN